MFTRITRQGSLLAAHPLSALVALVLFVGWLTAVAMENDRAANIIAGGAAVITLAIVFLLQHAQYHDTRALHAKIDELILTLDGPRDALAGIELRAQEELEEIQKETNEES